MGLRDPHFKVNSDIFQFSGGSKFQNMYASKSI